MSVRNKVPEYYRKKAALCRAIKRNVTQPDIVQALQELAAELETATDHMERKFGRPRAQTGVDGLS